MTYQNELANRQTAHRLRPARILVSKWAPALLLYGARAGSWLGHRLCKFLCFYASRADLAKQRRQLAEMPQWRPQNLCRASSRPPLLNWPTSFGNYSPKLGGQAINRLDTGWRHKARWRPHSTHSGFRHHH